MTALYLILGICFYWVVSGAVFCDPADPMHAMLKRRGAIEFSFIWCFASVSFIFTWPLFIAASLIHGRTK